MLAVCIFTAGAMVTRPRDGFSPSTPQHDAGTRMEPAASLDSAIGTMRAATAAHEPPLDPPAVRSLRHGLTVAP